MGTALWDEVLAQLSPAGPRIGSPADVAKVIDPRTVETPALALITEALVGVWSTPNGRLAISMPPQEGKTTRALRDFVVWALAQNPDCRVIIGTYGQKLATRNGGMIRNAIEAHPEFGLSLARDSSAKDEWSVAGRAGGVFAVGRGERRLFCSEAVVLAAALGGHLSIAEKEPGDTAPGDLARFIYRTIDTKG